MSRLYFINFFIIQWFFIRICRFLDDDGIQTHWGILFPVVPLTGWWSSYIPNNQKSIKVCGFTNK